jgi:hypothetical protein
MKTEHFTTVHVDGVPWPMPAGVMHVCEPREQAFFLCACGCEALVSVWLRKGGWTYSEADGVPNLDGSVLSQPCGAHYWIRKGAVAWA